MTAIFHDGAMDIQMLTSSPRNERGDGQVSHLLLAKGQFGSQRLCITWVECQPGSQQAWHRHLTQEQVYVIVRGQGQMLAAEYSLLPAVASHAIGYAESTHGVRFARDRQRQGNTDKSRPTKMGKGRLVANGPGLPGQAAASMHEGLYVAAAMTAVPHTCHSPARA